MIETTFKLDSLGNNIQYTGGRAKFAQVYRLICMKKGTDILNPDKGVDIRTYRFTNRGNTTLSSLEREIEDQINKYTPYQAGIVNCSEYQNSDNEWIIKIIITLANMEDIIVVMSNGEESTFDTLKL